MTSADTVYDEVPCVPSGAPVVNATIVTGPGQGRSINLRRAASLLGTKAGCKLVLRHQNIVRRHCVIVNTGQQIICRDLDTEGRTKRNQLKVEQESLEDADRLQLGPWELQLEIHRPKLDGAGDSPIVIDLEPDPTVLAIEDTSSGELTKIDRDVAILGRASGCDIAISDRGVSRVHAIIFRYLNKPALFDLCSGNGTFVNSQRATFAMLQNGDEITLGSYKVRFRSNTPHVNGNGNGRAGTSGSTPLKPTPFPPPPEETLSDLIDFSAESKLL